MVTTTKQMNNQVILVQACSWPARRQSFAEMLKVVAMSFLPLYAKYDYSPQKCGSSIYSGEDVEYVKRNYWQQVNSGECVSVDSWKNEKSNW